MGPQSHRPVQLTGPLVREGTCAPKCCSFIGFHLKSLHPVSAVYDCVADARNLMHLMAIIDRKSPNSATVSMVLPSMRPSDPPMSHRSDRTVYATCVSTCVYFMCEKNIYTQQMSELILSVTTMDLFPNIFITKYAYS